MSSEIIPKARRSRGRPRKTDILSNSFKHAPHFTPKRKQLMESFPDEIQILDCNGLENSLPKKPKPDDASLDGYLHKRSLPHRAARFTESYGGTSPDVVVISDEEKNDDDSDSESDSDCGPIPSPIVEVKSKEELEFWEENIQALKRVLCDEEMKLILLKKLQDSQKSKDLKQESNHSPLPFPANGQSAQKTSTVVLKSGAQIQPLPSKQIISNKFLSSKKEMKLESPSQFSKAITKDLPPTKHSVKAELKDSAVSVPSNSAENINSTHLQQYPLLKNLSAQITITAVGPPTTSSNHQHVAAPAVTIAKKKQEEDNLNQRQAAAKLALRKQLEKTLLQIPLPKPPPLKINFFPNANSLEFLCLLGLDFVVDFLTKSKKKTSCSNPLRCTQCATDFTCAWKWKEVDRNGIKTVDAFCEACINSNIRKNLKAQHTNSLKSAFLRALHQEKEIDRLSQMPSTKSTHEAPKPPRAPPAHQKNSPIVLPKPYIPKKAANVNHTAALAQMSKLNPQYQSLLQIQAQHLLASGVPLHPNMLSSFVSPGSRGKASLVQGDLRKQYRSDKVPPTPSSSWKA